MLNQQCYEWTVIGAGPAGIAAVGKLLDAQVPHQKIMWIDPQFLVGDFGSKWHDVSSNTKVHLFTQFLLNCQSFSYHEVADNFKLNTFSAEDTCELRYMTEPLQWITHHLRNKVESICDSAQKFIRKEDIWEINLTNKRIKTKKAIIATGSVPTGLNLTNIEEVSLESALNKKLLPHYCSAEDTIAVFGSSHSAIIVLENLLNLPIKKVINFYRTPLRYAVYKEEGILFDNTGLKGKAADWAKRNIDDLLHEKLQREYSSSENIKKHLPQCNKVIYATGFIRRDSILIEGLTDIPHNTQTGEITPGLFGLGIAFPEVKTDVFGNTEAQVGLWKFMDYLNRVLPSWLTTSY